MEDRYKYKIVKGEPDPYTDTVFDREGIKYLFTGTSVSFNGKSYKISAMPYKMEYEDSYWTIELEQE